MIKPPEKGRVLRVARKRRADSKHACAVRITSVEQGCLWIGSHAEKAVKDTWQ